MDSLGIVILAGGEGRRLAALGYPKPLAPLMGRKMIDFPVRAALELLQDIGGALSVVTGGGKLEDYLRQGYPGKLALARQENPRGTADALRAYFATHASVRQYPSTLVLCADSPLVDAETLRQLASAGNGKKILAMAATFLADDPAGYGRILRGEKGFSVVEERDAKGDTRNIAEVNSGLALFNTDHLLSQIEKIGSNNAAKEFYLTDIFRQGEDTLALPFGKTTRFLGVNTPADLEGAESLLRRRKVARLRDSGVVFTDSRHVYIEEDVAVAAGTKIFPSVHLQGKCRIGSRCLLEPGAIVVDSILGEGCTVKAYSYIEGTDIGPNCTVGPFARLRRGSHILGGCKIGNFVETKNALIGEGVSLAHLSYVGDAEIGEESNIGCGFITCNYDGQEKHKTIIGKKNFIGSDTQMIAPVQTGDSCYIASGSTINRDLPPRSFAISRSRQTVKEGVAKKFLKGKWKE